MDLRDYMRVFRAHWLGMLLIIAAGVVLAFGWTLFQPKVYTADTTAIVQATAGDAAPNDLGTATLGNNLANSRVKTYVALGTTRSVADRVVEQLNLDASADSLVQRVSVTQTLDTPSLTITAEGPTPEAARDLAQAWAQSMSAEVNRLESGDVATPGAIYLTPIDSAGLPTSPSSPNVRLTLGVGLLAGIVLAIAYALLRYTFDRRIRSVEAVERETDVAVVGSIPEEKSFSPDERLIPFDGGNSTSSRNAHLFHIAEAMRELRTNIQFMDVDNPPRTIVVTSPLPGDGKSTTASNLAIALASSGKRVVLIDGDLRRPMIGTIFGLGKTAGLSDVLAGRANITDVAQRYGNGNLLIVGAGQIPPNPSEVLGSERMRELLHSVAQEAIVIIDAPPLIPVTDAAVLTHSADGAIIVSTVGRTTYEVLGRALSNLERADARALGIVLNRVPRRGAGATYYGYQYHGEYYRRDDEDAELRGPLRSGAGALTFTSEK